MIVVGNPRVRRRGRFVLLAMVVAAASIAGSIRLAEPPRFDGAGYATLGLALAEGRGYRNICDPESPRHTHFPPGYPLALGLLWKIQGWPSIAAAHLLSAACTLFAVWATCRWWLSTECRLAAYGLTLALAVNWTWGRTGGSIQSEPLYLALGGLALLLASRAGRRGGELGSGVALGLALGACLLTRHVGACLALAVGLDLWLRARRAAVVSAAIVAAMIIAPWVAWQAGVRSGRQVELFQGAGLAKLVADQSLFYFRRIPDALTGPFIEAATVFGRSPRIAWLATGCAVAASTIVILGWARMIRCPRRRLGALIPLANLALLLVWPFTEAGRFLFPIVPFLLMGAVEGMSPILRGLKIRRPKPWAAGLVLAASLPYAVYSVATDRAGAQARTHEDFDAACRWIKDQGERPGPILASDPGDVFWLTGRQAIGIPHEGQEAIDRAIDRFQVAYLVVEHPRYANAPPTPLQAYVERFPGRLRLAWSGRGATAVYEIRRDPSEAH